MKKQVVLLNSGHEMPVVGLGTWLSQPQEVEDIVTKAVREEGYRHIDTAFNYNTEGPIGNALKKLQTVKNEDDNFTIRREDLFVTTKLPNVGNRAKDVERFLQMSLDRLQMNYVDLYLIHSPFSFWGNAENFAPIANEDGTFKLDEDNDILETWKEMEKQVDNGKAKSIGLSNFNIEQIERICNSCRITPAVLQVELHAYLQQKDLVDRCKQLGIVVTAYAPLGSPAAKKHFTNKYNYTTGDFPNLLDNPTVKKFAEKYAKTTAQILLRHHIQKGIVVIPKTMNPKRLEENIDVFDFEIVQDDMAELGDLDRGENGRIFDFLFFKGVEKHPEYPFKNRLVQEI